jgi:hypothetical protein
VFRDTAAPRLGLIHQEHVDLRGLKRPRGIPADRFRGLPNGLYRETQSV